MNCSDIRSRLPAFKDGELKPEVQEPVSRHLDSCPGCRQELARLARLADELAVLEDVEVRPYFITRLKQRIADREARHVATKWFPSWVRRAAIPVGAAAIVLLTALAGSHLGRTAYGWRAAPASGSTASAGSSAGYVLFDESSEGMLNLYTDQSFAGGSGE